MEDTIVPRVEEYYGLPCEEVDEEHLQDQLKKCNYFYEESDNGFTEVSIEAAVAHIACGYTLEISIPACKLA